MLFLKRTLFYRGWTAARASASWGSIPRPNEGLDTVGGWAKSVIRNWSRSITMWNLALDENGTPYIGHHEEGDIVPRAPTTGRGVITIDSMTRKISRSGRFWALAHYSKHVRRGAKVFRTNGVADSAVQTSKNPVSHVGFHNPDGSYVVVLSNRGPEKRVQLVLGSSSLVVELPADSVHTLQWS